MHKLNSGHWGQQESNVKVEKQERLAKCLAENMRLRNRQRQAVKDQIDCSS